MDIGKILSGFFGLFTRQPSKRVSISGDAGQYREHNVHNGTSGAIVCLILGIVVVGFVALAYIHSSTVRVISSERSCKSCQIDVNMTDKMLDEIRNDPNLASDIARRSNIDLSRVPDGYFVVFQRITPLLIDIIDNNLGDVVGIRPDISVASRFSRELRKYYPEQYALRRPCPELYIKQGTPRARRIPLTCYPVELIPVFDRFFKNVYQELYQQTYIENLKKDKIKLIQEARDARDARRAVDK